MDEAILIWAEVGRCDIHIPEHARALADFAMQAGRDAYTADVASGNIMPEDDGWLLSLDHQERLNRGKIYAGQLLSAYPAQFDDAFPLMPIRRWWTSGYDNARTGLSVPASTQSLRKVSDTSQKP